MVDFHFHFSAKNQISFSVAVSFTAKNEKSNFWSLVKQDE